jgi:hypothetical protein
MELKLSQIEEGKQGFPVFISFLLESLFTEWPFIPLSCWFSPGQSLEHPQR